MPGTRPGMTIFGITSFSYDKIWATALINRMVDCRVEPR
ncbi:hypothetical protein SAMN05443248_2291 [Bradyrhizobium erythrophlei]|uniref:Uncharacterized protein n=1 Tax=Bradyrhizobium erythrophlei TaxID=1437360 RepID=A0A1M5LML9_9BRAD|nr:hypothetical protein SAMN05443248_2291 [Bradyrhizobium erythrophlei]